MPGIVKDCSVIDDAAAEAGLKLVHCVFDRFRFAGPQCVSPQIQLIGRPVRNKVDCADADRANVMRPRILFGKKAKSLA